MRLFAKRTAGASAAVFAALAFVSIGTAAGTGKNIEVLGASKPVAASCPADCLVEAKVTGFQASIGSAKNPFRVPDNGRLVAWSVKLGQPDKPDVRAFNEAFGASRARISVLKPFKVRRGKKPPKLRYRLLRQGPLQDLGPFFGETTTFGLPKPLNVRRGNVVALTIPTWAPAFATGQKATWRASRVPTAERGECASKEGLANVRAGSAHEGKRTARRYGCRYRGARLLYSARFVRGK